MEVKWIVENFRDNNGCEDLIEEVRNQGMMCVVLDITNHFQLNPEIFEINDCVIFQGSIQLFRKLRNETTHTPLGWMTDPTTIAPPIGHISKNSYLMTSIFLCL